MFYFELYYLWSVLNHWLYWNMDLWLLVIYLIHLFLLSSSWKLVVSEVMFKGPFMTTGWCLFCSPIVCVANPVDHVWWVCVYFLPPVHAVFLNHEVVVFQPQTGTAPDLGFVANYTFYYSPPALPVSTIFLDVFIYPLYPTPPPSVAFVVLTPLYCTRSPPPLPERNAVHLDVVPTRHPPASAARLFDE